jgi:hypothetical protein
MKWFGFGSKYRAKAPFVLGYYAIFASAILLIFGYWLEELGISFILHDIPEIRSHVSNFAISLVVYMGLGYAWLLFGVKFRLIAILGVVMSVANLLCETVLGFMNTVDIVDALYGIAGVVMSFAYLTALWKCGLISVSKSED